jgi:fermentation-respiration switch protein FrsA (DUF1100 family)
LAIELITIRAVRRLGPVVVSLAALGAIGAPSAHPQETPPERGVGVATTTFVDDSRRTAANGDCAPIASRSLPTTIFYPAAGGVGSPEAQPDADPDTAAAPYPLIVFAHGFSATASSYTDLLTELAAAGYVVAAPTFPLSSADSPCGATAGDVVNQPEDLSFVIDSMLEASRSDGGVLAGLVDRRAIGAAGHSNGGVTMYGLAANTKRRDDRLDAVAALAGTPQGYPTGKYDFRKAPPMLIVHGTDDEQVPYDLAIDGFNRARGPKGLLTMIGGGHGSPSGPEVYPALTDFFDGYLQRDAAALQRLPDDQTPGATTMRFVAEPGARSTIPTVPKPKRDLKARVTPRKNLNGGQMVTVDWSGYTPGKAISILQCNPGNRDLTNGAGCDYTHGALLHENPTGEGSVQIEIVEGQVGDGVCDATHKGCFILVNNESSSDPANSVFVDITFAR